MKPGKINLTGLLILFCGFSLVGQDTIRFNKVYPAGIYFEYSVGSYAVKDQYISKEKYKGNMPQYALGWAREHEKYVYKLKFAYRFSSKIENNNASTEITQVTLNQGFLYPLKPTHLFNKSLYFYIGPSIDFIYYFNEPNIAVDGFDYAQSFAALLSVGMNADGIYPLSTKFQIETGLSFTLLSFALRMVDSEEDDQSPAKLLTLIKGINSNFNFGLRFFVLNKLSLNIAYEFQLLNISAWDPLAIASDNGVIGITYRF